MKRIFLFTLVSIFTLSVFAQKDIVQKVANTSEKVHVKKVPKTDVAYRTLVNTKGTPPQQGMPVGMTNYDLQSNSSTASRVINHEDGTISFTWTQYQGSVMPGAPERGAGYNFCNDFTNHELEASYDFTSSDGNETVDGSQRTGWPELVMTGNGEEYIVNHTNGAGGLFGWKQSVGSAGSDWTQQNVGAEQPLLWPRAASSGDHIYVIAVVDYDITYEGQSPAPVFVKSDDNGATWNGLVTLPGATSAEYSGWSGDSYSIDAKDNYVVIACFPGFGDVAIWKSDDYGETFIKTKVSDMPDELDGYDGDGTTYLDIDDDGVTDTIRASDNSGDVIIDNNNMVHVVFGSMRWMNSAEKASYFIYTDDILYWNENMGAPEDHLGAADMTEASNVVRKLSPEVDTIAWAPDNNGDNTIWQFAEVATEETGFGLYGCGITTMPSLAIDADNNIYCAYSTIMEATDEFTYYYTDANPNAQSYRHVWVRTLHDATGEWGDFVDVTSIDGTQAENSYPMLARTVDTHLHLMVQWDGEPGTSLGSDKDDPTDNFLIYKPIDKEFLLNPVTGIAENASNLNVTIFPNPVSSILTINNVKDSEISIYNILGSEIMTVNSINNIKTIDMSNLSEGTYFVKISNERGVVTEKVVIVK